MTIIFLLGKECTDNVIHLVLKAKWLKLDNDDHARNAVKLENVSIGY